jgi:hypothetical protein
MTALKVHQGSVSVMSRCICVRRHSYSIGYDDRYDHGGQEKSLHDDDEEFCGIVGICFLNRLSSPVDSYQTEQSATNPTCRM